MTINDEKIRTDAVRILAGNTVEHRVDGGHRRYTVPTHGLYPHQWNWDSAICSVGLAYIDPDRAFAELESLVAAQDRDGLIAHIAFDPAVTRYMPGPEWWGSRPGGDGRPISCITQPPVAAIALRRIVAITGDTERARPLIAPLQRWHDWFMSVRDPDGRGEPVVVHPWESGRDNAVEWDEALMRAPEAQAEFQRTDTGFVDAAQRPTKKHYQHYIGLVEQYRGLGWDQHKLAQGSAFRMLDPGFSAILAGACADLAYVAANCDDNSTAQRALAQSQTIGRAIDARRDADGRAWPHDLVTGTSVRRVTVSLGLQLLQPELESDVVDTLVEDCLRGALASPWGVCSTSPSDEEYDAQNYWRGPAWASATWLVAQGLRSQHRDSDAAALEAAILTAVNGAGFHEYFDTTDGQGRGGGEFSWTAAVALDALNQR